MLQWSKRACNWRIFRSFIFVTDRCIYVINPVHRAQTSFEKTRVLDSRKQFNGDSNSTSEYISWKYYSNSTRQTLWTRKQFLILARYSLDKNFKYSNSLEYENFELVWALLGLEFKASSQKIGFNLIMDKFYKTTFPLSDAVFGSQDVIFGYQNSSTLVIVPISIAIWTEAHHFDSPSSWTIPIYLVHIW